MDAAQGWDVSGGGVGTRDRERAARSGFATRIGSGFARSWGRRTNCGSARAAISSLSNLVFRNAASVSFRGEMNTNQAKEPGDRIAGFPVSDSAGAPMWAGIRVPCQIRDVFLVLSAISILGLVTLSVPASGRAEQDLDGGAAGVHVRIVHGIADAGPLDVYVDGSLALIGVLFPPAA